MKQYTGRERVIAAFKREYADRVPVTLILGLFQAKMAGISIKDFLTSADKLSKAVIDAYAALQTDTVAVYGDSYLEAEAIGVKVEFREDTTPVVRGHLLAEKSRLAKLNIPDHHKDKRLPAYLEACERVVSAIKEAGVGGLVNGPWNIAAHMRGLEQLLYDTSDDPSFVHELMRFATEVTKTFGDAQRQTGIGINIADAAASCSVISPSIYREFVKPYHQELITYFRQKRVLASLHICGYIDPIMDDVIATGVGLLSIDALSSLQKLVDISQKKLVVMGNVPTSLFVEGTKKQMEEAVKNCLDIAAKGSAYILCSGCEIPYNSSLENVRAFLEAGRRYGTYKAAS